MFYSNNLVCLWLNECRQHFALMFDWYIVVFCNWASYRFFKETLNKLNLHDIVEIWNVFLIGELTMLMVLIGLVSSTWFLTTPLQGPQSIPHLHPTEYYLNISILACSILTISSTITFSSSYRRLKS